MTQALIALTPENFQQVVLEESQTKLVLVTFFAEQIPESIELKDMLAKKLANVSDIITLATVDCMTQQAIAQQFGIQSLPTAVMVKEGQPVDGIAGGQTDEQVDEFLAKFLPKAEDSLLEQGQKALRDAQLGDALTALSRAREIDNTRADINKALADAYIQSGKLEDAKGLLDSVLMVDQDSYYHSLLAKLELAEKASNSPEIVALEQRLAEQPDSREIKIELAVQYSQVNRQEEALVLLYGLLQQDSGDQEAKKLLLDVIAGLPDGDKLASTYRRKLFAMMY
ncbi:tetratricopeptide repeat protein [Thalassotalea ponticola]|uniref:tetratricopeptide repeat protein n=1 Tax=Thalassotalea ponticola TaxID=1523392 RepID=UPI0025B581EB|nr:tetratricopeptide repeat protein [Thalassotalea ponticola]MDN3651911.1 tetratricopeptide repeat protein [Thalassotalea ponticola]